MNPEFTPTPAPTHADEEDLLRQRESLRRGLRRANLAWVVIVAVIAALVFGVVWKAGQSAREAERANQNARQAALEAIRANEETARAEAELWNARFTEARALRMAGGPGAGVKSSSIVAELARFSGLTEPQRLALRTEAIAQLALVDVELPPDLNARLIKDFPEWDSTFERYTSGIGEGDVEIVETSSSKVLTTLPVPRGFRRNGLMFSPDGRFLAGVFRRNASRVMAWRIEDGALVISNQTISASGYDRPVFSPDGRWLAVYTARALELRPLESNTPPRLLPRPVGAAFSPDAKALAVALRTNVEIWSVETGGALARVSPGFNAVIAAWHPDGKRLAIGGSQGELALWDPSDFDGTSTNLAGPLRRLEGHGGRIVILEFSPDGSLLLSTAWDSFSSLWETRSGRRLLAEPRVALRRFGAEGREIVAEGRLGGRSRVPLLNRRGFRTVLRAERLEIIASGAAFSRDGRFAATDHIDVSRLWDAASGRELARMPGRSPLFLPDSETLLTSAKEGVFRFVTKATRLNEEISRLSIGTEIPGLSRAAFPGAEFNMLSLAPDDRTLVVSLTAAGVALLDLSGERPLRRMTNVGSHFASLSADGEWLMTQVHNHEALLISLTNEFRPRSIGWHMNTAFSPDGRRYAASTEDTLTLAERNATNGWSRTARVALDLGAGATAQLAFSPDSRSLAVNTNRFDVHLLDVTSGRSLAAFIAPFGTPIRSGRSLSFSADGRLLRVLRQDGEIVEWDLPVVRAELAKLGLDWSEQAETNSVFTQHRTRSAHEIAGPSVAATSSLPAVLAGAAGLLALVAGVFVFAHQRRLLAGYAQAERLAADRQQQLGQAQQALFQSQKMEALGTLAAGVAHDFNNLLSIIRMSKQLVDRAVKPDGVTKENLEAIEQAVHQGKSLVDSMLGYSRRPTDAIEDFSVAKVVGDTVALLSRQFLSGLTLNMQLDQSCPPIHGSRARLEQALLNLIVNASEAMKGSGTLTVTARPGSFSATSTNAVLQPRTPSACVEVSISDTGPGIAPEVLPRIFEPFYTTKNAGTQRGTGLGLSLVYAMAKQDGWGLDVTSAPGKGSTFSIILPASQTSLIGRRLPTSQTVEAPGKLANH